MKADWTTGTATLADIADIEALVAELKAGEPAFGAEETVLTFVEADGTSFHSLGERYREGRLTFSSDGQEQEFLAEMAVPACFADEAVRLFFDDGKMPGNVEWEADW